MSVWKMCSKKYDDGTCQLMIDFNNQDATGAMSGTLTFEDQVFNITGNWAASGSVPGRHASAFGLYGVNQQDATSYVAVTGTMVGPGNAPESIAMNLIRAKSSDGDQYGWSGTLLPM